MALPTYSLSTLLLTVTLGQPSFSLALGEWWKELSWTSKSDTTVTFDADFLQNRPISSLPYYFICHKLYWMFREFPMIWMGWWRGGSVMCLRLSWMSLSPGITLAGPTPTSCFKIDSSVPSSLLSGTGEWWKALHSVDTTVTFDADFLHNRLLSIMILLLEYSAIYT